MKFKAGYQTECPLINMLVGIYNYKINNHRIPKHFKDLQGTRGKILLAMQNIAEYAALVWPWPVFSSGHRWASAGHPVHRV